MRLPLRLVKCSRSLSYPRIWDNGNLTITDIVQLPTSLVSFFFFFSFYAKETISKDLYKRIIGIIQSFIVNSKLLVAVNKPKRKLRERESETFPRITIDGFEARADELGVVAWTEDGSGRCGSDYFHASILCCT
jgi:hypothetical protein